MRAGNGGLSLSLIDAREAMSMRGVANVRAPAAQDLVWEQDPEGVGGETWVGGEEGQREGGGSGEGGGETREMEEVEVSIDLDLIQQMEDDAMDAQAARRNSQPRTRNSSLPTSADIQASVWAEGGQESQAGGGVGTQEAIVVLDEEGEEEDQGGEEEEEEERGKASGDAGVDGVADSGGEEYISETDDEELAEAESTLLRVCTSRSIARSLARARERYIPGAT